MKKKNFTYYIGLSAMLSIAVSSCELDEKFFSEVTPDTFITTPENTYAVMARPFTHCKWYAGSERWWLQELTADAMCCPQRGSDFSNDGMYHRLHYHTWTAEDRAIEETYIGTTEGIARALEAKADLEGVDYEKIGMTPEQKADQIQQLEAIIAYYYMKALDYFGGMPIYTSNNDELKSRSTDVETFNHIEDLLKTAIPNLKKKTALGASEDGYIKQAAAAAMLAQLYFNSEAYTGTPRFAECATICQDIIDGEYGTYQLDKTWWGPHGFDNDKSPEMIWNMPSENAKMEWNWYYKYFYHYEAYKYFDIETAGYNGYMLTPSLDPTGKLFTQTKPWKLGSTFAKFHDNDLRKKPYHYLGNKKYEGMFLMGEQINPDNSNLKCMGSKSHKGQVINLVDQVALLKTGGKPASELTSTVYDGEENSGFRVVKSPQPNMADKTLRYNPDCPMIRLSEIYFMLAECKLRAGDTKGAATLINDVRKRNFENNIDPNPATENNLDKYRMMDEWMTEFLAEGAGRRRTDLVRWNMFVTEDWWDHKASNNKNLNRYPLPNKAISANNLLKQNPGYSGITE